MTVVNFDQPAKQTINLKIWLVDLTYTQQAIAADMIPMAIGCIAEYVEQECNLRDAIKLFKYPEDLSATLVKEGIPDVIGFSCYLWNNELSLAYARRIKSIKPETIIVFGGPHYPIQVEEQERFLRKRPEIDFFIIKEAELAFVRLLSAIKNCNMNLADIERNIPSVRD